MEDSKDSEEHLTFFRPKEKYGILINGKSLYTGFLNVSDFPRWHPIISLNTNLYDWERLMTGTFDFGQISPLNLSEERTSSIVSREDIIPINSSDQFEEGSEQISKEFLVSNYFSDELSRINKNGNYKEVAKIFPGEKEVWDEFARSIKRYSRLSNDSTLTTLVAFSHGKKNKIQMGNRWITYDQLLKNLDKINGKKALFIYCCYSGSFLDNLGKHPKREDYNLVVSCSDKEISTKVHDTWLDDQIWKQFKEGRRFSELELKSSYQSIYDMASNPEKREMFDTKII